MTPTGDIPENCSICGLPQGTGPGRTICRHSWGEAYVLRPKHMKEQEFLRAELKRLNLKEDTKRSRFDIALQKR